MNLSALPLFVDVNAIGVVLREEDEDKLQQLISVIGSSKVFGKHLILVYKIF